MSPNDPPGAVPVAPQPPTGSHAYVVPAPSNGRKWTIVTILGVAAVVAGGVLTFSDRAYVGKETYHQDQLADTKERGEIKAAVQANTKSNGKLEETTEKLTTAVSELTQKLGSVNIGREPVRRRSRPRPP